MNQLLHEISKISVGVNLNQIKLNDKHKKLLLSIFSKITTDARMNMTEGNLKWHHDIHLVKK